jgi:hypothetical protein
MRQPDQPKRLSVPRSHAWQWTSGTEPNPFILTKPRRHTPPPPGIRREASGLVSLQTSQNFPPDDGFSWNDTDGIHVTPPPPRDPADFDTYGPVVTMELDEESRFNRRHKRLRRNVWLAGTCIKRTVPHGSRCWMITFTYATAEQVGTKQLSTAIDHFRKWCKRRGHKKLQYLWVAENQARGVPHYHLIVWLPKGFEPPPKFDDMGWWPHGMTNRKPVKHSATGYVMKYVAKWDYHRCQFPKGLRLYGSGGIDLADRRIRQWTNLPAWSRSQYGVGELRRVKGGILDIANDTILEPRYCPVVTRSTLRLVQVRDVIPWWGYVGPYSRVEFATEQ